MTIWFLLLGIAVGTVLGATVHWWWQARRLASAASDIMPADVPHVVDLLRRAYDAPVACLIVGEGEPLVAVAAERPAETLIERSVATARLAAGDARNHVIREGQTIVAAGDGQIGAAVTLAPGADGPELADAVRDDLRRLLAELQVCLRREFGASRDPAAVPDWIAIGSESLEGLAFSLCEAVRAQTGRPTGVVLRDPGLGLCSVVAVSNTADRRLLGQVVATDSAVGRACSGDIPVVGTTPVELFGRSRSERRRRREEGVAFPLLNGGQAVGALVVFGPPETLKPSEREWLMWMAVDAGPRLGAAAQVRAAETQSMTDDLTGLPNRRALERAIASWNEGPASLVAVDLDHFKQLNDGFGHTAGDAALRQLGRIFKRQLREDDVAARIGGEEFVLWLPNTPLEDAAAVGERIRKAVEDSVLPWGGAEVKMTCSVGVAGLPDSVTQPKNLMAAADAAMYQAKSRGRNRVQVARSAAEAGAGPVEPDRGGGGG